MVNHTIHTGINHSSEKNHSFFMANKSYTLSDQVLYDDASLYIAKEGEKLYFNFKKELIQTYNVLEAVAILINEPKFQMLPIWNIEVNELDKENVSVTSALYWLCHIAEVEEMLNLRWVDYCEHMISCNKFQATQILQDASDLGQIKDGIVEKMNYDKIYSQLIRFIL